MKTSLREKLVSAILLAAVLIVAANAWLAFRAEKVLETSEFWVAHTWEVIAGLDNALGMVRDAETGARGFLITGDEHYLARRAVAAQQLPAQLSQLLFLVRDNPPQEARMAQMAATANKRMDLIGYTVGIRKTQGQQAAFAVVREGSGLAEMDRLRALVAQMKQVEHDLLDRRQAASARARSEARATVAFASGLDIFFIIVTLWLLGYERALRRTAAETAQRLEKLQAISDVGLTRLNVSELTDALLERLRDLAAIDAVALLSWHEMAADETQSRAGEIGITAVNGMHLPPGAPRPVDRGTRIRVEPESPLHESATGNTAVRLHGTEAQRLSLPGLAPEMRSVMILPLSIASRVIGLLVVGRRGEDAFRPQEEDLLRVVADRIALAIDRTTLFDAERTARHQAERAAAEAERASAQVQQLNDELEERVRLRTAELEATNSELEAFSYSVSHDLRSPLRSVDGFSVALEEDYGELLTNEGKHYLGRIRAGVQRMGQLIDALLQLSRITRAEMTIEPIALSELAQEVAQELAQQNTGRQIEFLIEPGLTAVGDPRLLRAVFENMLGNAVKFTANVAAARIEVGYMSQTSAYYIRDNGAGFDPQYAGKLFVAFQRLHGEKDFKGSGIGLASVARVIRRHHGTMGAEGAVDQGAFFWFTLGGAS